MRLVIGCPVSRREWVLPAWFAHVEGVCAAAGVDDWSYVFVAAEGDPSVKVIEDCAQRPVTFVWSGEEAREDERCWQTAGRYAHMARVRNLLLERVRVAAAPDLFLSLDSDVLLHPAALSTMLGMVAPKVAVSSKIFMQPRGTAAPNFGNVVGYGGLSRKDTNATMTVDVIMAVKLMPPAAYNVNYVDDGRPEDIGWCAAARAAGVRLRWTGGCCSKHVMNPAMLDVVDKRCGF